MYWLIALTLALAPDFVVLPTAQPDKLWRHAAAALVLGALMMIGIGFYGPCMILISLLGMNPIAAFPIMMGACAFLMPVSGLRFVRTDRIDLRIVLGLALGGVPAVLLAAFVVKSLPLQALRWGVVVVVLYSAALLLRSAIRPTAAATGAPAST